MKNSSTEAIVVVSGSRHSPALLCQAYSRRFADFPNPHEAHAPFLT